MNFQSLVLNVSDIDRSLDFYREVFGFTLLSRKDQLAAAYAPGSERSQVIVFRSLGTAGRVGGARHVGIRALVLEVDSLDELERIGTALDARQSFVTRHSGETWTAVFGRDPDRIAVVAGTSLGPDPVSLDAWAKLDEALYALGE
jgi:catechol 2,3-dioxygenase-like lactoylglutathione lyase family enzyme